MIWLEITYILTGGLLGSLLVALITSSLREAKLRAAAIALGLLALLVLIWVGGYWLAGNAPLILVIPPTGAGLLAVLVFAPLSRPTPQRTGDITEQVDERDTMFAREEYLPGSRKYTAYYAEHPELKAVDDRLRSLPGLLEPGGRFYEPEKAARVKAIFAAIKDMTTQVDGEVHPNQHELDPASATAWIKRVTKRLGADDVGIARLDPMFVYSHVGRGPRPWGEPIENTHRYAIVFTLEMDYWAVETAPRIPACRATRAAIRQCSTMFAHPASSNQSTLPGLAFRRMKLSVNWLNVQALRSSMQD